MLTASSPLSPRGRGEQDRPDRVHRTVNEGAPVGKPGQDLMAKREARLAWAFVLPALGAVVLIALFPLAWTVWESLHLHDLRLPWRGRPFVGLSNYTEALTDGRFWAALGHTALFTVATVTLELLLGLFLALSLHRAYRGRGLGRTVVLLPWAIRAVVAALRWALPRDSQGRIVPAVLVDGAAMHAAHPFVSSTPSVGAWVPVTLGEVRTMTPFGS